MYDDDKIFPRLLQGLVDDANIDFVTINLEANDPQAQRTEERQPLHGGSSKKPRPRATKPIATFSSVVGGPVDPEILLPLRNAGVPIMEGAECATATMQKFGRLL